MKKVSFLFFFLVASVLPGQTPSGYVLLKATGLLQGPKAPTFQWIASNYTQAASTFFILDYSLEQGGIQSVLLQSPDGTSVPLDLSVPAESGGPSTIGPFPIAANGSVTLAVYEKTIAASTSVSVEAIGIEKFSLQSEGQLYGKTLQTSMAKGLSAVQGTPYSNGLIRSLVAAPNISRDHQPVNFSLDLNSAASADLALFTLSGEKVFDIPLQGALGMNALVWDCANNTGEKVASGLYIYVLQVSGNGLQETRMGKILILR